MMMRSHSSLLNIPEPSSIVYPRVVEAGYSIRYSSVERTSQVLWMIDFGKHESRREAAKLALVLARRNVIKYLVSLVLEGRSTDGETTASYLITHLLNPISQLSLPAWKAPL